MTLLRPTLALIALSLVPALSSAQQAAPTRANPAFAAITGPISKLLSGDRAFATVNYVQQFYRDPGSRGFDAAIDTVAHLLAAAGYVREDLAKPSDRLTWRMESRPLRNLAWSPLDASITLVGESAPLEQWSTNHNMLASNSWPTPPGGVTAEIVAAGSADVNGKIVFMDVTAGGGRGARGARGGGTPAGAIGILQAQTLPAYNQQSKNRTAINFRSMTYDSVNKVWTIFLSLAAKEHLQAALAKGPVQAHVVLQSVFEARPERTVVAEIRGSIAPKERFVYSAHVQEPGANDNATGVGLLAEMARTAAVMLKAGEINPGRTITMLWGVEITQTRRYIAEDSVRAKGIKWGMSLDMVGENTAKTGGTFLIEKMPDPSKVWVRGEDQHTEWGAGQAMTAKDIWPHYYNDFIKQRCVDQSLATGGSWVVKANPYEGGSDHTPYISAGIPGVLMWHFTDQHYHDDLDRIDMVSAPELQHVGNCALATSLILTAGNKPEYARAAINEMAGIAERRLQAEGKLSRAALATVSDPIGRIPESPEAGDANKPDLATQTMILEAWRDYYVGAIAKIPEMTLPHLDLTAEVAAAQAQVRNAAAKVVATLKR